MSDTQSREPLQTMWGAIPNYECPIILPDGSRCGFASLEYDVAVAHLSPKWGPHKEAAPGAEAVVQPVSTDERSELLALREKVVDLTRELSTTKGQLTRTKNQLDKATPSDDAPVPVVSDDATDGEEV